MKLCTFEQLRFKSKSGNEFDYFVRYNAAVSIIHKISNITSDTLEKIITSRKPFGLDSFERGHESKRPGDCVLISSAGQSFISKSEIKQGKELQLLSI